MDRTQRQRVLTELDRTLLVEAAAGSGKTSLLAGRLVMLLASGLPPRQIAAITFTEMAAGELSDRVYRFVQRVLSSDVPPPLDLVMEGGPDADQRANLEAAQQNLHELTCTTIHGFCRDLVTPYPVEANLDPGATVLDAVGAQVLFDAVFDQSVRDQLSDTESDDGVLAAALGHDLASGKKLLDQVKTMAQDHPDLGGPATAQQIAEAMDLTIGPIRAAAAKLADTAERVVEPIRKAIGDGVVEAKSVEIAKALAAMVQRIADAAGALDARDYATFLRVHEASERSDAVLFTQNEQFRAYQCKGKWQAAAKAAGLPPREGEAINQAVGEAWAGLEPILQPLIDALSEALVIPLPATVRVFADRYRHAKRAAACMDFEDLLRNARQLLRQRPEIRAALAGRYTRVLVDEFQDTDPVQAEILFLLCGQDTDASEEDWTDRPIRPGQLFLVGDPKQAIYRFRGADIDTYLRSRDALSAADADAVVRISASFRSPRPLIDWVNDRFEAPLNAAQQPGYVALEATIDQPAHAHPMVQALDVPVIASGSGDASAEDVRHAEAEAVADLCARCIGNLVVRDGEGQRPCEPRDIALLAPQSTALWIYERALEQRNIPIASTAGKGLYRRQEVQDLVALVRTLADPRDTLALGALLRGPLVGMTEQRLLDALDRLPPPEGRPDARPKLWLWTDPNQVADPVLATVLDRLQSLAKGARTRTPHQTLAAALEALCVRPLLALRSGRRADRALANVDQILRLAKAYAVRGLTALARDLHEAWQDPPRVVEGRPDSQVNAVSLVTLHSAKGLEWPVVVPINCTTDVFAPSGLLHRRSDNTVHGKILGLETSDYRALRDEESEAAALERVRLWYVACTRARDLLVLPRLDEAGESAWSRVVDLGLDDLPVADPNAIGSPTTPQRQSEADNDQTPETFATQARSIQAQIGRLRWTAPSSHDDDRDKAADTEPSEEQVPASNDAPGRAPSSARAPTVTGGRERGTLLHKLMEEILCGELDDEPDTIAHRAAELSAQLGATGLDASELAQTVMRTLALDPVAEHRDRLVAEVAVYGSALDDQGGGTLTAGVVDALAIDEKGRPIFAIDWKSDVSVTDATRRQYTEQIGDYLRLMGCEQGAIVYMSTGEVETVATGARS